ncbi:class II aldolase/adducin domain-containing protein [Aspergillus ellipticus CBS 707.79]|uniref:Class II aldolase/adducin domain-containing protein n=1 Tax=Aspergillus ellipticus CBS 707.79 TaxID=1448320 RepID=A0A319DJS9_9EURO|nr:class II aldolase/adducin domain-containing protein [Aspergillus ellipticus CBS 707.79]
MDLRPKEYFDQRATAEMERNLHIRERSPTERLACACRIIGRQEEDAGLAGQISARSARGEDIYWTLRFGLGFDEANPEDFIEVDKDLHTISGTGMANPATRFHLWVYKARPDINSIIHTHSPWASALAATGQGITVAQMDMTPLYDDCALLNQWPGVPIADQEGVIISAALGSKRSIILANHGQLTTGRTIEEATFLSVIVERAARLQPRATAYGPIQPVDGTLAKEAHDYLLQERHVFATFDYWFRQVERAEGGGASVEMNIVQVILC